MSAGQSQQHLVGLLEPRARPAHRNRRYHRFGLQLRPRIVRVEAAQTLYTSLQFTIRTLVPRTVKARIGQDVVWESMIDENASAMRILGLRLPPGETRIAFETDGPGVPESDDPKARKLTFALYNPSVTIEP